MKQFKWRKDSEVRTSIKKMAASARKYSGLLTLGEPKVEESIENGFWWIRISCVYPHGSQITFENLVKMKIRL